MNIEVSPATSHQWESVVDVFGSRAANDPDSCWCQRFRRHEAPDNRAALREELAPGRTPVGLIAFDGLVAVGWTRVVPRVELPGILENRALTRVLDDDPRAWWVACVVVRRSHRGEGVGVRLLEGAIAWADAHGASVLDGHPVDTAALKSPPSPSALFTGTASMFESAGFVELARTYPSRPVMRRRIDAGA